MVTVVLGYDTDKNLQSQKEKVENTVCLVLCGYFFSHFFMVPRNLSKLSCLIFYFHHFPSVPHAAFDLIDFVLFQQFC